jgi:hypothetical protein
VGPALAAALVAMALADLVTPLVGGLRAAGAAPLAAATILIGAQFAFGLAVVVYNIISGGLRQAGTPDALRGRVSATTRVLVGGLAPLGALLGGVLGERIGLQATLALAAGGELLAALWLLASPLRVLRDMPAPAALD